MAKRELLRALRTPALGADSPERVAHVTSLYCSFVFFFQLFVSDGNVRVTSAFGLGANPDQQSADVKRTRTDFPLTFFW